MSIIGLLALCFFLIPFGKYAPIAFGVLYAGAMLLVLWSVI